MQQPFDQKFSCQQLGSARFLSPRHKSKRLSYLVDQWQSYIDKLYQKCDRGRVKRNWLEGLSPKPGFYSLCFFQVVYWLEQRKIPLVARLLALCWWFFTSLDIYPERSIGKRDNECSSTFGNFIVTPIVDVPDRAKPEILRSLQALAVPCWRTRDGNIWVEIRDVNVAILVHNTIKESTAKSQKLVELLQHCWDVSY
ncbi:MAG: Asr1405/Asl0597 family protein [Cyanobacteria bacterium P01_E01_bin.35]